MLDTNENGSKDPIRSKELKLIQSLSDIQNPEVIITSITNKMA